MIVIMCMAINIYVSKQE